MKRYTFAAVALLVVLSPWRQTTTASQAAYTVQALGTSASIDNLVPAETGINASGEVVGTVNGAVGSRAVRFTDAAGWEYVPGLTWGSTAAGVNVHGDIVGARLVGGSSHAYRYNNATGVIDDIQPLPQGTSSFGYGINDNAEVVGQSDVGGGVYRAFIARPGQAAVQLPSLGSTNDLACGINNAGQIVETSASTDGSQYATRVEPDGQTILNAGTVDGTPGMSGACAIDELGHIGGFSSANSFAAFHAFRWDPAHSVIADAGLPATFGNVESIAAGVSAGWYQLADGSMRALVHTDANGAVDLNTQIDPTSGWVLAEIKGINASGQMAGDGMLNGVQTVFRLNPAKVKDTTPPVIAPHGDETAEAAGPSGAIVVYNSPTTTDAVDGNGTATCAPASGSTFALGTTTVTCRATDAAGNVATPTTFNVIVRDTTPPAIAPHGDVTAEATGPSGASVAYSAPATTDVVDGNGTAVCTPASGSTFALGATTVTCHASDAAGNAAAPTMFAVVVKDTTAPVIAAHGDVTASATGPNGASVAYSAPTTADAVDGNRTATCTPASGSTFALGTTTVTCNASDAAGNAAAPTTFKVIVTDTTAPVISMVYASPDAIWPPNGKFVPVSVMVTATDNVDATPSCSLTSISGGNPGSSVIAGQFSANVRAENGAIYVLTVTCMDRAGNKATASTTVMVTKSHGNAAAPKAK